MNLPQNLKAVNDRGIKKDIMLDGYTIEHDYRLPNSVIIEEEEVENTH